jgi:hypothetical protein
VLTDAGLCTPCASRFYRCIAAPHVHRTGTGRNRAMAEYIAETADRIARVLRLDGVDLVSAT